MSRRALAILLVTTVVISSTAGWIASNRIRSPAEVAARTAAPEAALILVPVESRVLSNDVVTRGTARFGSPQQLALAPSALKSSSSVVDTAPLVGTELQEGDIALTASGRPVFVIVGAQPAYRDLGPGLAGTDVVQLEEGLARLGFDPGPVDGMYDEATGAAVEAWYGAGDFAPMRATEDQLASIRVLEADLANARLDILTARDAVVQAQGSLDAAMAANEAAETAAAGSERSIELAQADADAADAAALAEVAARDAALIEVRDGSPATPGTAPEIAAAEADVASARANEASVSLAGAQAVAAAQATADAAPSALTAAQSAAAADDAAAAADVVTKQTALDLILATPGATPLEIATAQADLAASHANAESVRIAGEQAVAVAQQDVNTSAQALTDAQAEAASNTAVASSDVAAKQAALDIVRNGVASPAGTPAQIKAAEADLAAARAAVETARAAGEQLVRDARAAVGSAAADVVSSRSTIESSRASVGIANEALTNRSLPVDVIEVDLQSAQRRAGVQLPADEVIFVPSHSVRVAELAVARGDDASGVIMSVTDATVLIDGSLTLGDAPLVSAGMNVVIDELDLGIDATGVVSTVAEAPGTNGVDGFHIYVEIIVDEPPPNLVGASVRLTIPVESSSGATLAVPASAVTLDVAGNSRVERDNGGVLESVVVEPGLSAEGYVGVVAREGTLTAGDLVVIGVEATSAAADLPAATFP